MTQELSADYWQSRYEAGTTGWDMGEVSPPLKAYFDTIENKDIRILIPGCGNAWEAKYLVAAGFTNITVIDIAAAPVAHLRAALGPEGLKTCRVVLGDFFAHTGTYDLIVEQTFFCAIDPAMRSQYAKKMAQLLAADGVLMGVLFKTLFDKPGPPFGGTEAEYRETFAPYLAIETMAPCYNSHEARRDNELFIRLRPLR